MDSNSKIYIAGHQGLVGSALVRACQAAGFTNLVTRSRAELDLTRQAAVEAFYAAERPAVAIVAAAKVGGIHANNTYPAEFLYQNLMIESNLIHGAWQAGVQKLLFLGSTCIYPKLCPQPIREEYLLTGPLEPTNEAYAIAKIAGVELCKFYRRQYGCDFIAAMPTNLYGINDNFDLRNSHVLPALLRKFHEAKRRGDRQAVCWGSGSPCREFLFVDDLADACLFLLRHYSGAEHLNVGTGEELTIRDLAEQVRETVGFTGEIVWDRSQPDGTPRKLTDVSRLHALGWRHRTSLRDGLRQVYDWYLSHGPGSQEGR
ncbi:MAG: GDP-L-fucose synthase [Lentisphaeria bacterium]|jgi:GDP-L-fucose synthase